MSKENSPALTFNRGLISKLALARLDLKRTALSAETQTNWMPRVLGSMMLRPGLKYVGSTKSDAAAVHIPFVFSLSDKAIIELTANNMRVRVDEAIITRGTVSTAITNGLFTTNLTGWTDSDEGSAVSSWLTGGYMALLGTGTAYAIRDQQVTVAAGDINDEHGLHIHIARGPVEIRVGSSAGGAQYFSATLDTGEHSLAVTPTGNIHIRFQSRLLRTVLVDSIAIEAAGDMELGTSWDATGVGNIRYDQSGDIIFVACRDVKPQKIERRATRSWSVVSYETNDGPFRLQNTGPTTITPSAISGDVTLTASNSLFKSGHVGAIFSVDSTGQEVISEDIEAEDTFTNEIRVTGIESSRIFTIIRAGISDSTITLQRSVEVAGSWEDVTTYTTNATITFDDNLDNQIVFYRIGIKAGDYGTDTVDLTLRYPSGSITGIARITAVASETSASAVVLKSFGGTDASDDWAEGPWSTYRGWPTSVAFYEGRLFWAGKDKILGSVSDSFYSFDDTTEGDAGPINRSIGSGPVDNINWLIAGKTLLAGGEGAVKSARSSSLEEVLTPTNFNLKDATTQGTANIAAVKIDKQVVFVQSSGIRAYEIQFDSEFYDYDNLDLTAIVPEIGEPSIVKIIIQRQPDTRIHFIRSDGKVAILIYDKVEEVKCWVLFETDGTVEDGVVIPSNIEDNVYYLVNRTINGGTKRYLEKWALESESKGGAISKLADSHLVYSGVATTTITGLTHLEGESVVVWGNTKDLGTYTVTSGAIELSESVTYCVVGLTYNADFKSSKASLQAALGIPLCQKKQIGQLAVMLMDTHYQGLQYGTNFDTMYELPLVKNGAAIVANTVHTDWDQEAFPFPGSWNTDSRLCLRATAPRACTVLAVIPNWNMHEKG